MSFLESVPDGSTIVFSGGGIYRLDRGIFVSNRRDLVFDGKGATLRATGPGDLTVSSPFLLDGANRNIAIRNFIIEGMNLKTGSDLYDPGYEDPAIAIYGGSQIEIAANTIRNTFGDGVYANEKDTIHSWVNGLWVHDNSFSRIGRMGVTFNAVSNGIVEGNRLNQIGMFVFDIEPGASTQGARDVVFRNNTVGTYGLTTRYTTWFFASANDGVADGAMIEGITISGNQVTGGAPNSANTPDAGGLATWIGRSRIKNVTFVNNQTTKAGRGPVLVFEHVDGLIVTGNVQPVLAGSLMRISDSTGVVPSQSDFRGFVAIVAMGLIALGGGRLFVRRSATKMEASTRADAIPIAP